MPQIKQQVVQAAETAQKAMEQIDMKKVSSKVQQAVQQVKRKIDNLKKSNKNNELAITVNNKEAQKQISQVEKQIDSLQKKISASQMKLNMVTPKLDAITQQTTKEVTPEGISSDNLAIQNAISNKLSNNKEYTGLAAQEEKLVQEIKLYNTQLDEAKAKMSQLKQEANQISTSQNKLTSIFSAFKSKLEQAKASMGGFKGVFNQLPKITQSVTNNIKKMGTGLKSGLGHILKYAAALFSLRSIYSTLSNLARNWLSSENAEAKQANANIEYMKNALSTMLAPALQFITNLVYQLLKAIQSLVYAFSGINIFAKATASSMSKTASSANKASKSLSGVHGEINNVSENDESGGSGTVSPSMDLSEVDGQMTSLSRKLYDFFKPLKESWDNYGTGLIEQVKITAGQVGNLIATVWKSFEKIIVNGTVYSVLQNILKIIGNIAKAFSNAWKYNSSGDRIVQNLADMFNNLLIAINNVAQSEEFQNWLNWCSNKLREISEKLASIDWQPLINALVQIGSTLGSVALDILSGLIDIFKWLVENPVVSEILLAIGIAIGIVATAIGVYNTAMGIYNTIMPIATAVSTAFGISIGWLIAMIAAIIAIIALVVLAIMNWDTIMKALADTWNWICEQAQAIWNAIAKFFSDLLQGICDTVTNVWNGICDFISQIWNSIRDTASSIFNGIKDTISNVFNEIKDTITNIWNNIVDTISSVWNTIVNKVKEGVSGAWNAITSVFGNVANWFKDKFSQAWQAVKDVFSTGGKIFDGIKEGILSGLKTVINAIITGINKVIAIPFNGINTALRALRNLDLWGWQPFSWLGTINVPQIPTLAKGNVAYSETMAIFGEYAGASTNPEITTPQNIMRETFDEVLSNHEWNNQQSSNSDLKQLVIQFGSTKVALEIERLLQQARRQNGVAAVTI